MVRSGLRQVSLPCFTFYGEDSVRVLIGRQKANLSRSRRSIEAASQIQRSGITLMKLPQRQNVDLDSHIEFDMSICRTHPFRNFASSPSHNVLPITSWIRISKY